MEAEGVEIYLREGDDWVGPFGSRQDAQIFLLLMELSGSHCDGIEIVERCAYVDPERTEDVPGSREDRPSQADMSRTRR